MEKKVRLGLIGAGWVARQHLEVIRACDALEAVGITSRTIAKARDLAGEFGIKVCTNDVAALLDEAKPDALMVLVSEDQMFEVGRKVMSFGLPLFLEKPAGLTPLENLELAQLADQKKLRVMVGFNRRYYSIFSKGLEIIKDHGPLLGVSVEGHERMWKIHASPKFSKDVLANWIFANSTHTIDLLRFFGGDPKEVKTIAHKYVEPRGDQFAAIMELSSGAIGQYSAHWYSPGGWKVTLYGDGVTVEFKPLEKGIWMERDFEAHTIEPDEVDVRFKPGFYRQIEAFAAYVRSGQRLWPIADLYDAYKTMALAEHMSHEPVNKGANTVTSDM